MIRWSADVGSSIEESEGKKRCEREADGSITKQQDLIFVDCNHDWPSFSKAIQCYESMSYNNTSMQSKSATLSDDVF